MYEKALGEKLKAIFEVKKIDYGLPGETQEQECLFIAIEKSMVQPKDGMVKIKVTGTVTMFAFNKKLPFGYFNLAISKASNELTKDIFFYDFEENTRSYRDIVQRSLSFVYFFSSQYDPSVGTIESLEQTTTFIEES